MDTGVTGDRGNHHGIVTDGSEEIQNTARLLENQMPCDPYIPQRAQISHSLGDVGSVYEALKCVFASPGLMAER